MPTPVDARTNPPKKRKLIKSAFDSESFDADGSIHVDGLVGSATISPSGRDVALASPDGLAVIDLDSPYSAPRRLRSHGLPWLVVDVQWSPFAARDYWIASTANHRCLVWNLNLREDSPSGAIEHSLQGHSRAITDVNFSAHHPDLLATCAVDGYVHCWDLRRPRQPALTFCDWLAGATQVKYNRQDPNILASSHNRWLHIWDERKAAEPLKSISAHTSKIYGIDWNRTRSSAIVTCSLDKSIKFWDYSDDDDCLERVIRTDFPVWRARHTPFGCGLLAMPQNEPGDLYLYDMGSVDQSSRDGAVEPVAVFHGHGNRKVKEFLWRSRGGVNDDGTDNRDFQLVSWGEDNELRLQRMEADTLEAVGYTKGALVQKNLNITRKGAAYKTFRTVDDNDNRHRRTPTMSDPRPGSGGVAYRRSALTMGMHSPYYHRAGSTWKGPSMRAKVASTKDADRGQVQVGWMRGITMNKRKSGTGTPKRNNSKDSTMFSAHYHDVWGEPETIQDEFVRISKQLPNVKWEDINMDTLTLNASLQGPWGVEGDTIFIKVKVDIPGNYPKSKAPKFFIEKTSFMPEETHKKIAREVQDLTDQFVKRNKNCLNEAFSYLLGEVDLEESTSFFKNVKDLDDDLAGLADESSSEDDDNDIPAGGSAAMSQELPPIGENGNTSLSLPNRGFLPLDHRICGARFSNDGRLLCFFPSKEEKAARALLFASTDASRERSKGEPTFAGFGRLTPNSPSTRHANGGMSATDSQSEFEDSDESSSSGDSELASMHRISLWYQPGRKLRKTWSANDSIRSSGAGTGPGTGTGTGTSRRRINPPKNTISIYDTRLMLPSKMEFAQEYAIFGEGAEVCEHNANVADRYGYKDLVDVWKYAALLLRKDIPLQLVEHNRRRDSILVIAQDAVAKAKDSHPIAGDTILSGRVKWGQHPLAQDFIHDLFEYFEQLADIQMLAMLSCIFSDSSAEDSIAYAESRLTQPETPLPMKAPSFSLEYFPTDNSLWLPPGKSQASSGITTPRTAHTPILYSDSQASDEAWGGEPGSNSFSCGETPPPKLGRDHLAEIEPAASLSTSPDSRFFRRTNSTIVSSFAASLPRTFSGVVSSSPPAPPSRKRPSPAEAILGNLAPSNITWGGSTVIGAPSEPATARTSISDDDNRRDEVMCLVPVGVAVFPEDQSIFDDDGWMNVPLLEPSRSSMYASYRYAYAEMLQMWNLPLSRLEVMKFNVLKEDQASSVFGNTGDGGSLNDHCPVSDAQSHNGGTTSPILLGKKEQLHAVLASSRGLDVTGICRTHETQLDPVQHNTSMRGSVASASSAAVDALHMHNPAIGGAVGTCHRCHRTQTQLRCVYCAEPIDALYPPCLSCGCASHEACLAEWHGAGETECPAGDECACVDMADNGMVESWAAVKGEVERTLLKARGGEGPGVLGARARARHSVPNLRTYAASDDEDEDDEDEAVREDWESIASGREIPTIAAAAIRTPALGLEPISAARLSLGNRLKKSAGEWSRPAALRRKSGGVPSWRRQGG